MIITSVEPLFSNSFNLEKIQKPDIPFSSWILEKVQDTNTKLLQADNSLEALASGQGESLHQTMLTLEEARLSFQLLEQIRTRLMQSWQELAREQI